MTPHFRDALRILGWRWCDAGEHLSKGRATIARYARSNRVPPLVERELQRLITAQHKERQRKDQA